MVSLVAKFPPMAKQQRNDEAVRMATDVVRQARVVAAAKGLTIGQYLSDLTRPHVAEDYRRLAESMAAEVKTPKRPTKP